MRPYTPVFPNPAFSRQQIHLRSNSTQLGSRLPWLRVIALVVGLLLMVTVHPKLFAQQAPDNGEYTPEQQPDDNEMQPGYAPPQASGPQSYPPEAYPDARQTDTPQGYGSQGINGDQPPLSAQDLDQLVAPIALYPDALVAQVLTASTYPDQVAEADHWRRAQGYASSDQIAAAADPQPWDPSVKALTAFPQVLAQMDQNLNWATELGNAYYNQPQDVLQAVQVMRQRAQAAGNLRDSPQETVSDDQGNIVVAPANPQVIYVPAYNPWAVYGQPVSPYPGFSVLGAIGSFVGSAVSSYGPSAVRFGLGIAMTAFLHTPWGWLGWGLNWLAQSVLFHQSNYYSHSNTVADWGLPHGGPRAFSGRGITAGSWNRSYRGFGGFSRSGAGYGGRSQAFARTRDEDLYARNRSGERYSPGNQSSTIGGRTSRDAYRGFQPAVARSQQSRSQQFRPEQSRSQPYRSQRFGDQRYGSSGYGSNSYSRSAENYGNRMSSSYGGSLRTNRTPGGGFQRSGFGNHSSFGFNRKSFSESGKHSHSGGFRFGGHAPKNSGGGRSFSRGHSGGGHSGGHGHSGGKHHH